MAGDLVGNVNSHDQAVSSGAMLPSYSAVV